jgi:hypothetical protein
MLPKKNNVPSFLLKNINYTDLYAKYKNGYFNRPIPDKTKLKVSKPAVINVGVNNVYNSFKTVEIAGGEYAKLYTNNVSKVGGTCMYCNKVFDTEIIGFPLAYEEKAVLNEENIYQVFHLFWIEGCFHSYECCLAYCQLQYNKKYDVHFDIVVMLKYMYSLINGKNALLKPANDRSLLIENGGTMNYEDWVNKEVQYVKSYNVIKIPAQVAYFKK